MIQKTGIMVDTDPTFPNQTVFEQSGEQRMITAIGLEPDTTYHVKGYVVVDGERVYSNNTKQFTTAAVSYLTIKSTDAQTNWVQLNKYGTNAQNITVEYSTDGRTWTSWTAAGSASPIALELEYGESIMFRGINNVGFFSSATNYVYFSSTGTCEISGDVNTLINKYGGDITLPNNAFRKLFYNMTKADISGLVLPSTTLSSNCYQEMFYGCRALTTAPVLHATTLGSYCYHSMFISCTSLTQAPALNATTLTPYCYSYMFQDCTSLTQAPALPATTLVSNCYNGMFTGCTSIRTAPVLPATTLVTSCYRSMFYGCSSLNKIITYATTWSTSYASNWVQNVAPTGDFYNLGGANIPIDNNSGVPIGWTLHSSLADYFTIENTDSTNRSTEVVYVNKTGSPHSITLEYSTDNGSTWTSWDFTGGNLGISLQYGEKVMFRSNNPNGFYDDNSNNYSFNFTGGVSPNDSYYSVYGDINTLINKLGGDITLPSYCFHRLFIIANGSHVDCSGVVLPSTTLSNYCYQALFAKCEFTTLPTLPATTLATGCYKSMFSASNITSIPSGYLRATTLADECYLDMFHSCSSLTTVPSDLLQATTLADSCYRLMFFACTALTQTPALPATTLASNCYYQMFYGCTSLNKVITYASDISATDCITSWLSSVAASGDFYNLGGATYQSGASGIPSGWTEHTSL